MQKTFHGVWHAVSTPLLSLCRKRLQQKQDAYEIRSYKRCPSLKTYEQSLHLLRQAGKSNPAASGASQASSSSRNTFIPPKALPLHQHPQEGCSPTAPSHTPLLLGRSFISLSPNPMFSQARAGGQLQDSHFPKKFRERLSF